MLKKFSSLIIIFCLTACQRYVLLKQIDFEVDPNANNGQAFACHIVVPYGVDLGDQLKTMDSQSYFTKLSEIEKHYKDSIEIFKYDIIPGKNQISKSIEPKSRTKARGVYLFAKYTGQGNFSENIGLAKKILVQFQQHKMEVQFDTTFKKFQKAANKVSKEDRKEVKAETQAKSKKYICDEDNGLCPRS